MSLTSYSVQCEEYIIIQDPTNVYHNVQYSMIIRYSRYAVRNMEVGNQVIQSIKEILLLTKLHKIQPCLLSSSYHHLHT